MEAYFKFKYYSEMITLGLLIGAFVILTLIIIVSAISNHIREKRINKFFTSHGYERRLLDVSSVGGHGFWGWVRVSDHKVVEDRDIKNVSVRIIKRLYK